MQNNSTKRESVQKVILALLISYSKEVPLEKLNNEYKNEEGEYIPWKELGYTSLHNCLKNMPNISLKCINDSYYVTGSASDKSKHISSLIARQKKGNYKGKLAKSSHYFPNTAPPKIHIPSEVLSNMICKIKQYPCGIDKRYIIKILKSQCTDIRIHMDDLDNILQKLSHILYVQDNLIFPKESKTDSLSDKCYLDNMQTILTKAEEKINFQNTDTKSRYCVSGDSDSEINIDDNDLNLIETNNINGNNENGKTNKRQPISTFIQETVPKSNEFNNTLIHNTEEILHNNSKYNQIQVLADKMKKYEEDITYLNEENAKLLISNRTKVRLEKLMQKYPNGIWCAELPIKYLEEYNVPLNYIELGFSSVREFASYLPEIFSCKQLQPSGDYILYNANNELNDIIKKERKKFQNMCEMYSLSLQDDNELEALPILVSPDTSNKLIPEGVMTMGESVGYINVINLENGIQPYIEVFVEEVFTPSFFWVQLRKKRKLFNKLMEELHAFYQEKCMLYKIPPVVIEEGLNCACVYNKEWHRGIIKKVKPDLQVIVMFYDYGTLKTYPPDAIYYLHRSFSYIPAQAIPCGLYNTKPCTSRNWSHNAIHKFALRIHQKPLIATIASTDPENNSMLVTLTDTMEEEDVHINDWLVHQNLAVHGTLVCMSSKNFPYSHYLQCKQNYKTNVKDLVSSNDLTKSPVSQHLHGDAVDMSNLILYEEENLLHYADKFYGEDYISPAAEDNGKSTEFSINAPLISPQSTLYDKPHKLVTESTLPAESPNLLSFLQGSSIDIKSVLNPFVSEIQNSRSIQSNRDKLSINPFLENMGRYQEYNNLSPGMFIQIWDTNPKFQRQIIAILNILTAKLNSTLNEFNNYSLEHEISDNYEQRLLYATDLLESIILKEDISSLLVSKPANYFSNMKIGTNSRKDDDIYNPQFLHDTDYTIARSPEICDNSISKALLEYLKQIDEVNSITLNSIPEIPCSGTDFLQQDINNLTHSLVMDDTKVETSAFQCQNGFKDNEKNFFNLLQSEHYDGIKDNDYNETNPFKVLLKLKDRKNIDMDKSENLNTNLEKHYSLSNTIINKNHFEINNTGNHTLTNNYDYTSLINMSIPNPFYLELLATSQKNPFYSLQKTENAFSSQVLQSETVLQNIKGDQYQLKEECNAPYNDSGMLLNSDHPDQLSSIEKPVIHNEKYIWFNKLSNLSTSQIFNKLDKKNVEEDKITNPQEPSSISAESWIRDAKNKILSQAQDQDSNDFRKQILPDPSQILNKNEHFTRNIDSCYDNENSTNKEYINNHNDIHYQEPLTQSNHNNTTTIKQNEIDDVQINIPYYEFLINIATEFTKLFLRTVDIQNKTFCIFHFEDEGWLLLHHFIEVFTDYVTISEFYKQLETCHINVKFKEISRFESPTLFFELDRMILDESDYDKKKLNNIHLIPLKSVIKILMKLQIVSRTEVENFMRKQEFTQDSILYKVWILINNYGKLRFLTTEKLNYKKT